MRYNPKREHILTAYAQSASGPGWGNQPIWVVIRGHGGGDIRLECIQPNEQTATMSVLYAVSQAAHLAMVAAVERQAMKQTRPGAQGGGRG